MAIGIGVEIRGINERSKKRWLFIYDSFNYNSMGVNQHYRDNIQMTLTKDQDQALTEIVFKMIDNITDSDKKYKINTWGKDHMAFMLLREDKGEE